MMAAATIGALALTGCGEPKVQLTFASLAGAPARATGTLRPQARAALGAVPAGTPYGWQDKGSWGALARWMRSHRLVRTLPSTTFSSDFLPGVGV